MPTTRSGRNNSVATPASQSSPAANKRKAEASPQSSQQSKPGKKAKGQQTLEETLDKNAESTETATNGTADGQKTNGQNGINGKAQDESHQEPLKDTPNAVPAEPKSEQTSGQPQAQAEDKPDTEMTDSNTKATEAAPPSGTQTAEPQDLSSVGATQKTAVQGEAQDQASAGGTQKDAVQEDKQREEAMPSNILEKGIIYFFTRGRVGIDGPESVQDLQRSYFVLRPLPRGGKITDGGVQDSGDSRLLALPKKVWPKSGKDRFMVFVEKAKVSIKTLKEDFFQGSEYTTQTVGVRHTPPVAPIGEGVYAITTTGGGQGTTHLAYMLTVPDKPGQVQSDVGITEKGSFVLSMKNPEASGPAYASLPEKPDFPKEFIDEFRGRGWMPLHPKHLDYPNAQLLIIGEDFESSNNLEPKPKDEQDEKKETPQEELEKLEQEDTDRVEALKGDDTIFIDLDISKKEYSGILTTW